MERTTLLANDLLARAKKLPHLSHLTLRQGEMFRWDHTACVITYNPTEPDAESYLLHEFGHAVLQHSSYTHDIDLLKIERAAWQEAVQLGRELGRAIASDLIEDSMDTYRDWLHNRSLCPACAATGTQISTGTYRCIACRTEWQVNDARNCSLKRRVTKKPPQ